MVLEQHAGRPCAWRRPGIGERVEVSVAQIIAWPLPLTCPFSPFMASGRPEYQAAFWV